MKADLTRQSFDPAKAFSSVVMQQGRVQLDADWNEQASILQYGLRRLAMDIGGQVWTSDSGFLPVTMGTVDDDVAFTPGSFYVDGVLCDYEATPVALTLQANSPAVLAVAQWTVDDQPYAVGQYLVLSDGPLAATNGSISRITAVDYAQGTVTVDASALATDATNPQAMRLFSYLTQPWVPVPPPLFGPTGGVQLYLDVWERLITCLEDDSIREVALNGPDTAARTRVVWQVRTLPAPTLAATPAPRRRANAAAAANAAASTDAASANANAAAAQAQAPAPATNADQNVFNLNLNLNTNALTNAQIAQSQQPLNRGLLRARVQPAAPSTDPCAISPTSSYRGPENQLYRVEIHDGGLLTAGPTFKWSRENGSVLFPVSGGGALGTGTVSLPLGNLGRDDRFGLAEGEWVELQDDSLVLANAAITGPLPALLQVQSIDVATRTVTLAGVAPSTTFGTLPTLHPVLRRWDQQAGDPAAEGATLTPNGVIAIPATAGQWIDLEDGVQVLFEAAATATFRAGDYWLIPARVATGNVIWPQEWDANNNPQPVARAPDGVDHHYAGLAIINPVANAAPTINSLVTNTQV